MEMVLLVQQLAVESVRRNLFSSLSFSLSPFCISLLLSLSSFLSAGLSLALVLPQSSSSLFPASVSLSPLRHTVIPCLSLSASLPVCLSASLPLCRAHNDTDVAL